MTFLAPLFLLGAAAIVGPILFHLIRRTTREVTPFSTLMFLEPSPPRITKRSRLENLLLLLLRCAAIALLALAFGRPFFRETAHLPGAELGEGRRIVLLMDTSASMRTPGFWDAAIERAKSRIDGLTAADELALVSFDRTPREDLSFEEWRRETPAARVGVAHQRLAALKPGFASTALDRALIRGAELLDEPEAKYAQLQREIVVISDLQEGAQTDGLQGYRWPQRVKVTLDSVGDGKAANAGVAWLPQTEEGTPGDERQGFRLRVTNSAENKTEQFALRWMANDAPASAPEFTAYAPAGKTRVVRAPKPPSGATRVTLTGDAADFDNSVFLLEPQPVPLPILFIGTDADEDPKGLLYYVRRAFPPTERQKVEVFAHRSADPVPEFQLQQAQLAILGQGAGGRALESVARFVEDGKIAVAPLLGIESGNAIAKLLGRSDLPVSEASVKDYAMLAQIDFQHPLFGPFADPRFSDFTKIHIWKHRRLGIDGLDNPRVLARFDNGDPAIVQTALGRGSVVLFATSWRPADSQLALSSKFLPLLQSLLDQSSQIPPTRAQYFVGDEIPLPLASTPRTLHKPDGTEVPLESVGALRDTDLPGIYTIAPAGTRFVVNLSPDESRTSPIGIERFVALGVPLSSDKSESSDPARETRMAAVELENRQKLWRWAIVACLALLLIETILSGRRSPARAETAVSG